MRLTTLAIRNVIRRPARSSLTICGLALAVGTVVALVGIAQGFEESMVALYEGRHVDIVVVQAGGIQKLGSGLDEGLEEEIRRLPGVRTVSPGLADMISLDKYDMFGVLLRGLSPDSPEFNDVRLVAGRRLNPGDGQCIMLGKVLAKDLDKSVGDTLEVLDGQPHEVVGVYESFSLYENGSILMLLKGMQQLLYREGEVSGFAVICDQKDEASIQRLCEQIRALAGGLDVQPTQDFIDSVVEIRSARAMAWFTSAIALVVGTIGTLNTMLMAVFERLREIAVLRAIGWRKRRVVRMVLYESILLALVGAGIGTLLAIGLTQFLSRLPAADRLVSGEIAPSVLLQGLAIAIIIGVVGGLYPAYLAARVAPATGLRYE